MKNENEKSYENEREYLMKEIRYLHRKIEELTMDRLNLIDKRTGEIVFSIVSERKNFDKIERLFEISNELYFDISNEISSLWDYFENLCEMTNISIFPEDYFDN